MTQIQKIDNNKAKAVAKLFETSKDQIHKALQGAFNVDKFTRVALTAYRNGDESLALAEPISVVGAVIQAAQLGLSVDPLLGEAYIVARKNKKRGGRQWASLMIGYQGLMKRCRMSPDIAMIDAGVVREGDEFERVEGTNPSIRHVRCLADEEPAVICTYAIAHYKDDRYKQIHICPIYEINAARKLAAFGGSSGPWKDHFGAMAMKTAIIRLMKKCPMDDITRSAISSEEKVDNGDQPDYTEVMGFTEQLDEEPSEPKTLADLSAKGKPPKDG